MEMNSSGDKLFYRGPIKRRVRKYTVSLGRIVRFFELSSVATGLISRGFGGGRGRTVS